MITKRCLIRPFIEQDLVDFMAYRNDPDWMRYQSFKGLTVEAYREALLSEQPLEKGGQLAIVDKALDRLVGDLYIRLDVDEDCYWIGFTISPAFARQGYAFETVSALIDALIEDGAGCIKADVDPENAASIGLLIKLGFVVDSSQNGELIYRYPVQNRNLR